jgi:glycosyltransferase involved in cell wall biosynthesis
LRNLISTLKKEAPEVVQTTEHVSSPSFWVNANKGDWNSVLIERAGEWDGIVPRFKIHRALAKKIVIPKVDGFGALSSFAADILRELGCKKEIASIPNPIDIEAFTVRIPWSERKNVILYVGRLTKIKMVHILIMAMPLVHEKVPDAELWLIGDGEEEANYKILAAGKSYIRFLGSRPRSELSHYYNQARMLVMLSNKKMTGIGVATEEAMACGVPIVGSKGIPFDEDENVFYFKTELTPEDFAKNIIRCLVEGEKQSLAARAVAEKKYSYDAVGAHYKIMLNGMTHS